MMRKIGDCVWLASYSNQQESETCPVCFGKLTVRLILGNGDEVILPCRTCALGYDPPTGIIKVYKTLPRVESKIITGMDIDGTTVKYKSGNWCMDSDMIFDTHEEAMVKAESFAAEEQVRQNTLAIHIKENNNNNYSWNAGYHMQLAKRDRKSAERHERLAILCRAKARK
jgi:hypothetical protein